MDSWSLASSDPNTPVFPPTNVSTVVPVPLPTSSGVLTVPMPMNSSANTTSAPVNPLLDQLAANLTNIPLNPDDQHTLQLQTLVLQELQKEQAGSSILPPTSTSAAGLLDSSVGFDKLLGEHVRDANNMSVWEQGKSPFGDDVSVPPPVIGHVISSPPRRSSRDRDMRRRSRSPRRRTRSRSRSGSRNRYRRRRRSRSRSRSRTRSPTYRRRRRSRSRSWSRSRYNRRRSRSPARRRRSRTRSRTRSRSRTRTPPSTTVRPVAGGRSTPTYATPDHHTDNWRQLRELSQAHQEKLGTDADVKPDKIVLDQTMPKPKKSKNKEVVRVELDVDDSLNDENKMTDEALENISTEETNTDEQPMLNTVIEENDTNIELIQAIAPAVVGNGEQNDDALEPVDMEVENDECGGSTAEEDEYNQALMMDQFYDEPLTLDMPAPASPDNQEDDVEIAPPSGEPSPASEPDRNLDTDRAQDSDSEITGTDIPKRYEQLLNQPTKPSRSRPGVKFKGSRCMRVNLSATEHPLLEYPWLADRRKYVSILLNPPDVKLNRLTHKQIRKYTGERAESDLEDTSESSGGESDNEISSSSRRRRHSNTPVTANRSDDDGESLVAMGDEDEVASTSSGHRTPSVNTTTTNTRKHAWRRSRETEPDKPTAEVENQLKSLSTWGQKAPPAIRIKKKTNLDILRPQESASKPAPKPWYDEGPGLPDLPDVAVPSKRFPTSSQTQSRFSSSSRFDSKQKSFKKPPLLKEPEPEDNSNANDILLDIVDETNSQYIESRFGSTWRAQATSNTNTTVSSSSYGVYIPPATSRTRERQPLHNTEKYMSPLDRRSQQANQPTYSRPVRPALIERPPPTTTPTSTTTETSTTQTTARFATGGMNRAPLLARAQTPTDSTTPALLPTPPLTSRDTSSRTGTPSANNPPGYVPGLGPGQRTLLWDTPAQEQPLDVDNAPIPNANEQQQQQPVVSTSISTTPTPQPQPSPQQPQQLAPQPIIDPLEYVERLSNDGDDMIAESQFNLAAAYFIHGAANEELPDDRIQQPERRPLPKPKPPPPQPPKHTDIIAVASALLGGMRRMDVTEPLDDDSMEVGAAALDSSRMPPTTSTHQQQQPSIPPSVSVSSSIQPPLPPEQPPVLPPPPPPPQDRSSILHRDAERRNKAVQLAPLLDQMVMLVELQPQEVTNDIMTPILNFVLECAQLSGVHV